MDSGATPFSQNFAKVCDLTLNADKHYSTGTAAPKAASADQWATNYYGDPLTWKSIAFEVTQGVSLFLPLPFAPASERTGRTPEGCGPFIPGRCGLL